MNLIFNEKLKPKPVTGAYKYSVHWVEGGSKLKYLSGSMYHNKDFSFKDFVFKLKNLDNLLYNFEKFKQFYIYNYLISYVLKKVINYIKRN